MPSKCKKNLGLLTLREFMSSVIIFKIYQEYSKSQLNVMETAKILKIFTISIIGAIVRVNFKRPSHRRGKLKVINLFVSMNWLRPKLITGE